jgi:hypothetical protein
MIGTPRAIDMACSLISALGAAIKNTMLARWFPAGSQRARSRNNIAPCGGSRTQSDTSK